MLLPSRNGSRALANCRGPPRVRAQSSNMPSHGVTVVDGWGRLCWAGRVTTLLFRERPNLLAVPITVSLALVACDRDDDAPPLLLFAKRDRAQVGSPPVSESPRHRDVWSSTFVSRTSGSRRVDLPSLLEDRRHYVECPWIFHLFG